MEFHRSKNLALRKLRSASFGRRAARTILCLTIYGMLAVRMGAAEGIAVRPLHLVSGDAAVICEISRPKAAWEKFRQDELFRRLEQSSAYQELLKSDGYRQWQELEQGVAAATGMTLSSQLLELFGRELVLAVYLSAGNQPEGVLIARAEQPEAVQRFLQSWKTLEPNAGTQPLKHQGQAYSLRASSGDRKTNLYYVTFGTVFAISDQESRIKQVIELQQSETAGQTANRPQRLAQHPVYLRAAPAADDDAPATMRLVLMARAWERVWEEASWSDAGAAMLHRFWPAIDAITLDVRTTAGIHVTAQGHLNADRLDDRWKAWSGSTSNPQEFVAAVPEGAVLASAGGFHFTPLWQFVRDLASSSDRDSWQKGCKLVRGMLGGRDLLDDVLPALCHDIGLYLVPAEQRDPKFPYDGVLVFRFPPQEVTTGLHLTLDQALSSGLTLLSVQSAEKHPEAPPAIVRAEVADGKIVRWLETSLPIQVAYQLTPTELTVSRSIDTLRRHAAAAPQPARSAFAAYRERWFSEAGQFVCVDVKSLRDRRHTSPAAAAVLARPDLTGRSAPRFWLHQALELCDVAYFATKFDAAKVTLRLGVAAEAKR